MTHQILDVDFVRSPFPFDRHVVYRYRTGVLRSRVLSALSRVSKPLSDLGEAPIEIISQPSAGLFADDFIIMVNLSSGSSRGKRTSGQRRERGILRRSNALLSEFMEKSEAPSAPSGSAMVAERLLAVLGVECASPAIILAHAGNPLFFKLEWPKRRSKCLFIDEAVPSMETVNRIISCFEESSDLMMVEDQAQRRGRIDYSRHVLSSGIADRSIRTLRDAEHAFDRAILLYGFPGERSPSSARSIEHDSTGDVAISSLLERFVRDYEERAGVPLLQKVGALYRDGRSGRQIVGILASATQRIFGQILNSSVPTRQSPGPAYLAIWVTLLLLRGRQLIDESENEIDAGCNASGCVVLIDQMMEEFKGHASRIDRYGLRYFDWRQCISAVTKLDGYEADGSFAGLINDAPEILSACLPRGLGRYGRLLAQQLREQNASNASSNARAKSDKLQIGPDPSSLAAVRGNQEIINQLLGRFHRNDHSSPVLLYGPSGVGKRAIARAYARTFLCHDRQAGSDEPCGNCAPCQTLENDMGFIEFDWSRDDDGGLGRELSRRIGAGLYPHNRMIIIRNAALGGRTLDALLGKLETVPEDTAIVLTVGDPNDIAPTIKSRCNVHGVRALGSDDARALVTDMLHALQAPEPQTSGINLIALASRGLPMRMWEIVSQIASRTTLSLDDVIVAAGFESIRPGLSFWSLLAKGRATEVTDAAGRISAEAIRQVLLLLHPSRELPELIQTVLSERDKRERKRIISAFSTRTSEVGLSPDEFWARIAGLWTSGDEDAIEAKATTSMTLELFEQLTD